MDFLAANVNDTSSFSIEYTPYDHLMTVQRVLQLYIDTHGLADKNLCAIEVDCIFKLYFL